MQNTQVRKLLFFGHTQSRKTQLLHKILKLSSSYSPPLDKDNVVSKININIISGNRTIQFIDMRPLIRQKKALTRPLIEDSNGLVFVYEANSRESFDQCCSIYEEIMEMGCEERPCFLIAYVADPSKQIIQNIQGKQMADKNNMIYLEISKTDESSYENILDKFYVQVLFPENINRFLKYFEIIFNADIRKKETTSNAFLQFWCLAEFLREKYLSLKQKISDSKNKEKNLIKKVQMLKSQIQILVMKQNKMTKKIQGYQYILEKSETCDSKNIWEVANTFQADNLIIKQKLKQMESELTKRESMWRKRCISLESICQEIQNITIHNVSSKLNKICEDYRKYILLNCQEESITAVQIPPSEIDSYSPLLQGLGNSTIFEYE